MTVHELIECTVQCSWVLKRYTVSVRYLKGRTGTVLYQIPTYSSMQSGNQRFA